VPQFRLYTDLLPNLNAKTIRLVDKPRLVNQLAGLNVGRRGEGRTQSITHRRSMTTSRTWWPA
jgi:hypothetical protein